MRLFCMKMEYGHYPPRTLKNNDLELHLVTWAGMDFYVLSVPLVDRHLCEKVAAELGMRLASGVPHVIFAEDTSVFPMEGKNVWTLEGQFDGDEEATCEKILADDRGPMLADFRVMTEIRPGDVTDFIKTMYQYDESLIFWTPAEVSEAIVGYILNSPFACCIISATKGITKLYVPGHVRGLGIGTKLFVAAAQRCLEVGFPMLVDASLQCMVDKLPEEVKSLVKIAKTP